MEFSVCYYPHSHIARRRLSRDGGAWVQLSRKYCSRAYSSVHLKCDSLAPVRLVFNVTPSSSQASVKPRWIANATTSFASGDNVTTMKGNNVEQPVEMIPEGMIGGSMATTGQLLQNNLTELADELGDYLDQLKDFQKNVENIIETGDRATANALVKANYKSLLEQLDQGNKGLEQAAMLDVLIQLNLMLQEGKAVQQMLKQMKEILVNMEVHEPFLDAFLEHMGSVCMLLGNKEEALACYNRSIFVQESLLGENSPELVGTLLALAGAYTEPEERQKGKDIYNRILHILEDSKGNACEELGAPLLHLGYISLEDNNLEEAELYIRRALNIAEQNKGKGGSIGVATCGLARVKYATGDRSKAAELYQSGLDILKKSGIWSSGDIALESIKMEAAEFFSVVGRTREAQDLWEEVLHEKERLVGVNSPRLVVHLQNLAVSYAQDGKFERCEPLLRRSLKLLTNSLGPTAPQVSIPLEFLASTLHHLDQNKEAESLARQSLSLREKNFPEDHLLIGEACNILASILHANSRDDEALKLAWRAFHIKEKHLGKNSKQLAFTLDLLLDIMDALGKTKEAKPVLDRLETLLGGSSKAAP